MVTWKDQLAKEWLYLCGIVLFTLIVWSVFFAIREPGGSRKILRGPNRRKECAASLVYNTGSLLTGSIRSLAIVVLQDAEE